MKKTAIPIVAMILGGFARTAAFACPMCKDSIPNSDAAVTGSLPSGFNVSVYYMLIGLFVTIALVTGVIVKGVRSTSVSLPPKK